MCRCSRCPATPTGEPGQQAEPQRSTCTMLIAPNQPAHHLLLHDTAPHIENTSKYQQTQRYQRRLGSYLRTGHVPQTATRCALLPRHNLTHHKSHKTTPWPRTRPVDKQAPCTQHKIADFLHAAAPTNVTLLNTPRQTRWRVEDDAKHDADAAHTGLTIEPCD